MSSIWSSGATQAGSSPFASSDTSPKPGGGAVAHFQSLLSSSGQSGSASQIGLSGKASQPATQLGLSPETGTTASVKAAAQAASGSNSSSSGANITANDFLTLLVTEMKNQDPTSNTDPNAYVDQLVQINSLEQLIAMNQNLALVLGTVTSPVPTTGSAANSAVSRAPASTPTSHSASSAGTIENGNHTSVRLTAVSRVSSAQDSKSAHLAASSLTVAHALDGHLRPSRPGHAVRDTPMR